MRFHDVQLFLWCATVAVNLLWGRGRSGGSSFSLKAAFCVISSQVFQQMSAFYINQPGPVKMIFRKKSQVTVPYHVTICCCACSTSEACLERRVHGCRFPCYGAQNDCAVSSFCLNDRNIYYRQTPDLQNNLLLDLIASFKKYDKADRCALESKNDFIITKMCLQKSLQSHADSSRNTESNSFIS